MNKRLLRSYNMDVLEENNEERINVGPGALSQAKRLTSRDIDVIYAAHNVQTDRSNIDKLFKHAKDGKIDGWLDKVTLEKLTLKDRVHLQETFNQLKNSGITPEKSESVAIWSQSRCPLPPLRNDVQPLHEVRSGHNSLGYKLIGERQAGFEYTAFDDDNTTLTLFADLCFINMATI
ncbi:hypothetical protein PPTG_05828 [Phytophthora nicotianae INRA-310]|uniref:RxLR effector protein n=2 Tax=Phytophthora nicotianae TaxID=4792 RepID=W2QWK9_PHYN3|nr:hypothetical protein PPTG_05828 [Phytophthora nicotianae INRA-310]ETN16670.1 hypothetical protein PPTG_05828 [Phytophthora nicotianae INRA-310]